MKMRNSDYFMEEKIFTFREFQKISYTKNKKIHHYYIFYNPAPNSNPFPKNNL